MSTNFNQIYLIQNAYQNAGTATTQIPLNNLPYTNATAEDFNTRIGSSEPMAQHVSQIVADEEDQAVFGTHLREAASTLRKLFAR